MKLHLQLFLFFFLFACIVLLQSCSNSYEETFYNRVAIIDSTSFYTLKLSSTIKESGYGSFSSESYNDVKMYLVKYSITESKIVNEKFLQKGLDNPRNEKICYTKPWLAYICNKREAELWVYNTSTDENIQIDSGVNVLPLFISTSGNYIGYKKGYQYKVYNIRQKQLLPELDPKIHPFYFDENKNELHVVITDKTETINIFAIYDVDKGVLRDSVKSGYMVNCLVDRGRRVDLIKRGTMGDYLCLIDSVRSDAPIGFLISEVKYEFDEADFCYEGFVLIRAVPAVGIYLENSIGNEIKKLL